MIWPGDELLRHVQSLSNREEILGMDDMEVDALLDSIMQLAFRMIQISVHKAPSSRASGSAAQELALHLGTPPPPQQPAPAGQPTAWHGHAGDGQ